MPVQADDGAWKRLGEMLEARRVQLDPRYKTLKTFAEEREIDYRLAWDIEHAARTNYRRPTLIGIDAAYGWEAGSIQKVLEGGRPVPARGTPGASGFSAEDEDVITRFHALTERWRSEGSPPGFFRPGTREADDRRERNGGSRSA